MSRNAGNGVEDGPRSHYADVTFGGQGNVGRRLTRSKVSTVLRGAQWEQHMQHPVTVSRLEPRDQQEWEPLARGYKAFYRTAPSDSEYEIAWTRLMTGNDIFGLGARVGTALVGIAHYLFHSSTWSPKVCYLQDLFVCAQARNCGVGRTLIEAVAADARNRGACRYYWLTHESNADARALYDKVAKFGGFLRYEYPLIEPA